MSEPKLRLLGGWRDAVRDLEPSAERWWITPLLSDEAFAAEVRPGDRVLVRGDPDDVERGRTDLELLRWLAHAGVEVRRHPKLHLRAYVAVHPDGPDAPRRARAWVGTADATRRGRGERFGGTLEVMAGPFALDAAQMDAIDRLWDEAASLDLDGIEEEVRALRRDAERIALAHASDGRWTVRIEVEAGSQRWTPPHVRRRSDPDAASDEEASVPFLPARHPLRRDVVAFSRALRTRLRSEGLLVALPGELGANSYLVASERAEDLRRILALADRRLRERFRRAAAKEREALAADFAARVEAVLAKQAEQIPSERGVAPSWDATRAEARRSFEGFLDAEPVAVRYALALPVDSNDVVYEAAADTLQPTLLPSVDGDPERLVEDALQRAGRLAADE